MVSKVQEVLLFITQLSKPLRGTQLNAINSMLAGLDDKNKPILRSYYGYLLQRFLMNSPKKALANLIITITDTTVVSQSRINRLCSAYVRDPHPAIASVLKHMRIHASPNIYFPPTGLSSAEYAQVPAVAAAKLRGNELDTLIPLYTKVAAILQNGNTTSISNALAQLYPLSESRKLILLPIEEYFYKFLGKWDGASSPIVNILLKYLRFWPDIPPARLKTLLLDPLSRAQNPQVILHDVVSLGGRGEPLVRTLLEKIDNTNHNCYVPVLLFYMSTDLEPPAQFLYQVIINCPGLLFICRKWANLVPEVKNALQGEPSFVKTQRKINPDDFALANNPWLGNITITAFEEMADSPWPGKITETELEKHGIAYTDFCNFLLDDLASLGLYIDEYLA